MSTPALKFGSILNMKICYVDEAGCTGALKTSACPIQPTMIMVGVIIDYSQIHHLTDGWLSLKQTLFPNLTPIQTTHMGWILPEIKGSDIRRESCSNSRNSKRHSFRVLEKTVDLLEAANSKLTGRVWVKGIGAPLNGTSVYTYSVQSICYDFQNYLASENDIGVVILDGRLKHLNTQVAHSIFTQKFKGTGDALDRIVELPSFSHSDNHAGLQIADMMCSGILTPMAVHTYCEGHVQNAHVRSGYIDIKQKFSHRVKEMQHRYQEASGRWRGGIVVSDSLTQRSGGELFR
ncbi:DUF3800 domain-containing protein [Brevundimonas vancanneytii]|uniref:Protein of uncharacterized function (DUF3800) n=1 Tax=Brevundimonas vancanneytii TaxID=1325724 RepID=A0A4P1KFJ0_9CAUL|nr:DUF3800 domain-containing protein [Brevundimonas vancanneytii]VTO18313.1 Protein of uncharacterised function (DUF3800) [Brevundimonas vancanneytii]